MNIHVYHNTVSSRFEANVQSGLCELDYEHVGSDILDFKRTYVPETLRHQGIGHRLVREALDYAKEEQYHVKPSCPFVKAVADEYKDRYKDVLV